MSSRVIIISHIVDPDIIVITDRPCCYIKDIIVLNSLALLLLCDDDCVCVGCDNQKLNFY